MSLTTRIEAIAHADRHVRFGECYVKKGQLDRAIRRYGQAADEYHSAELGGRAKAAWLRRAELCDLAGDVKRAAAARGIAAKIEVYEPEEDDR
jgi:hypothetical protein